MSGSLSLRLGALVAALALGVTGALAVDGDLAAGQDTATPASVQQASGEKQAAKKAADPRKRLGLFVDPLMPAYQRGGVYRTRIGRVPQAFWVIPEAYGVDSVRWDIRAYTDRARAAKKTPMVVIYGIPGRDCGSHSADGALKNAAEYRRWIRQVARGLKGQKALAVLEPDALPLFSSPENPCPTVRAGWEDMLRYASKTLARSGTWVYLDAGHSNWTPYDARPAVLKRAGVKFARGISTNVSNFRPSADEHRYAKKLVAGLRKLGIKGKRYIVDTSRNGNPTPSPDGWDVLNPTWARIGKHPKLVFKGAFDGTLWVKHPGESDGQVNGGPPSGDWCDLLADRLLNRPESGSC